jgi:subtilisin family serine protease
VRLEDRTLPSATPALLDRGDYYYADGRAIGLSERVGELAVRLTAAQSLKAADADGPLAGFQVEHKLDANTYILTGPGFEGPLPENFAWATPVFLNAESGTWMVAVDQVIVTLRPGEAADQFFAGDARFAGYHRLAGTPDEFVATVAAGAGRASVQLADALEGNSRVSWASPNFFQDFQKLYVPNDPLFPEQWHLNNTGQNNSKPHADVSAPAAWDIVPGGSPNVVIGIIDDGMEYTHPDLAPNLFVNAGEIAGNGIDDDRNGWVDDVNGWDFTSNDNYPGASSINDKHATSVAGIAAAAGDNGIGVAGIAYKSRLLPVRIFGDDGAATTDDNIASAVYYAAGRTADGLGTWRAADILSNSWGGGAPSSAITAAFTWASTQGRGGKGTPVFIASGNNAGAITYPATLATTLPGVMAVGASTDNDVRAPYSDYGAGLDFVAPSNGGNFGTVTTDRVGANGYNPNGDYTDTVSSAFGGTSSATPLAAGIGALVLARAPQLTPAQVQGLLRATTDLIGGVAYDPTTFTYPEYGYGRVNAAAAVAGAGVAKALVYSGLTPAPAGGAVQFRADLGATQTFTLRVRDRGSNDLTLGAITLPAGPFTLVSGFSATTLHAGESAAFTVSFTASTGGLVTRTLSFPTNDPSAPVYNVTLSGSTPTTQIVSSTPAGQTIAPVSAVTFAFNSTMDTTSFSLADVAAFTGPAGSIISQLTGYNWVDSKTLQVQFNPQTVPGAYHLVLGPNILNSYGQALDQNNNGIIGEIPGDQYAADLTIGNGPSDGFGYVALPTAYNPSLDLSPSGSGVNRLFGSDQDAFAGINLGTNTFRLYGTTYTGSNQLFVDSNGMITFGSGTSSYLNSDLNGSPTQAAIAPLWTDLTNVSGGGGIEVAMYQFKDTNGDGVPDWLVVKWRGEYYVSPPSAAQISFEAALQLNTGTAPGVVVFNYTNLNDGGNHFMNHGLNATTGLKAIGNPGSYRLVLKTAGVASPLINDGTAVRISVNRPPTAVANGPYTVALGGTVQLSSAGTSDPDEPASGLTYLWDLNGNGAYGETGAAATRGDEVGPNPTFRATGLGGGAVVTVALRVIDSGGLTSDATAIVNVVGPAAPRVTGTQVNDDSAQRSRVTSLQMTFSTAVTFAGAVGSAFTLTRNSDGAAVTFTATQSTVGGATVVTLTGFGGSATEFGSLADGRYTLTALASQISAGGQQLDGNGDGTPGDNYVFGDAQGLFRYYGDVNGDQVVNGLDFGFFRTAFGTAAGDAVYLSYLDVNGDGAINGLDFGQFRSRFGTSLP